jgi:hypothetical protein
MQRIGFRKRFAMSRQRRLLSPVIVASVVTGTVASSVETNDQQSLTNSSGGGCWEGAGPIAGGHGAAQGGNRETSGEGLRLLTEGAFCLNS